MEVPCSTKDKTSACDIILDRSDCLTTIESRSLIMSNVQLQGSECGWCPNGPCTTNNANRCEPIIWLEANSVTGFETCNSGINSYLNCRVGIIPVK